ncbi:MAG: HesA/MoeB/ThiF family protein [Neisseriaceae bacterium]|nr:HesA/MoeB/ThiF family protein [Neisseriaceae bacterium]MBR3425032.1 HesA/MoeB/ThiF family protein [Neisseriaceae bacterium]
MNDAQLLRYSRHILLDEIGIDGQEKLAQASVAVVGCGGLGCAVLPYLVSSGVGKLLLMDDDKIELSNLQRQVLYTNNEQGCLKAETAARYLQERNTDCKVQVMTQRVGQKELREITQAIDIIVDCTDNFPTRHAINAAAFSAKKPLISGAVSGFTGQIATFDFRQPESPCYACIFPDTPQQGENCATFGVFAPMVGIIGTMQAAETLKTLLGLPNLCGKMQIFNAKTNQWQTLILNKNPDCCVCGTQ